MWISEDLFSEPPVSTVWYVDATISKIGLPLSNFN
jgi:hypothetical protein